MTDYTPRQEAPVALVTGAARRIGAVIAEAAHEQGYRVVIHCNKSAGDAKMLAERLNERREDSAFVIAADLLDTPKLEQLAEEAAARWGRLDLLVNNASTFYPTPMGKTTERQWDDLVGTNFKTPFFLSQAAAPHLARQGGMIINLVDIHAERPLAGHPVYSSAKAALHMLTRSLAKELGPDVRVNGISPGAILWPESGVSEAEQQAIIDSTPLARTGSPADIAQAVIFLARSSFITGQVIAVDGGRSL